ncbi:phosphatidylinositol phosphatase PTPRQ [Toxorhynchites rutilus septentrionalis]|uniref:phosphatidylinositol phosphatase PTPRQ n=1 Tax=Toxorhynchites rutilus septentrionalis TaxID=329112 RepID=UPI00247929D2|nr:phosphatidylinositol phosphatase PTPRQ [Toxorhynchites rutilus septentrionalis]XP_055632061.1 phosphatidylinositol phosphatase PTPRQ [Toxorhynchites rutilus septentrionalis]XP_055632062.1 phosphatidylinositol phosphatase PTPRQ [Toxorhynchites rutilus septentrionalis]XP_055632063.1 phosphatidylinositol phosphatase PTPRQ [Toxorhynchites rutilus septentrionalis]XP_055632064.1 phosphatidylinositol phosphatase PTPRQ [Toxorhynchites rutilus septentrionalis]
MRVMVSGRKAIFVFWILGTIIAELVVCQSTDSDGDVWTTRIESSPSEVVTEETLDSSTAQVTSAFTETETDQETTTVGAEAEGEDACSAVSIGHLKAEIISRGTVKISWVIDDTLQVCVEFVEVSNGNTTVSVSKDSTSYTFKDLPKCYQYHFEARIVNYQGAIGPWKYVETHVVDILASFPSSNEAQISWSFTPELEECVGSVTVTGEDFERTVPPNQLVVIPALEVCRTYRFEVAIAFLNERISRRMIDVKNNGQFKVAVFIDSYNVNFAYPTEGLACVDSFKIRQEIPMKGLSDEVVVNVPDREYTGNFSHKLFTPNETCASRVITVIPIHTLNIEGNSTVLNVKHPDIGPVRDIVVDEHSVGRVTLSWKKPAVYGECVREFWVTYLNENITVPAAETSIAFNGLDACRTYMFSIMVIDMEGALNSQAVEMVTIMEESIGRVADLRVFTNSTQSVWLEWGLPKDSPYCIGSYQIEEWVSDADGRKLNTQTAVSSENDISALLNTSDVCSLSSVSVTPISKTGLRGDSATLTLREPVQQLQFHVLSVNSVRLEWYPPPRVPNCVSYYTILRQGLQDPIINTTSTTTTIGDLKSCKTYTIQVVAVNHLGLRHSPAEVTFIVEEHISAVQNIIETSSWIEWQFPANGAGCVRQFRLTQTVNGSDTVLDSVVIDVKNTATKRPGDSDTYRYLKSPEYVCTYWVITEIIPVSFSDAVGDAFDVLSPPLIPGPVVDVTIDTTQYRQVTIRWKIPVINPQCVHFYRVSYEGNEVTTKETYVTIIDLHSCLRYNFTIVAVGSNGTNGKGVNVSDVVREEKISGVQELKLSEVDPRSLSVKWTPPVNGTFCVVSYRLVAWVSVGGVPEEQFSNITSDTYVTFGEVMACAEYSVQVIPVSSSNNDGMNVIEEIETKSRVVRRYHIEPVRMSGQMARSLELQASLTSENNNLCQLLMIRFICRAVIDVLLSDGSKEIIGESSINETDTVFTSIVSPLDPYTKYNCTARIMNIAGWSEEGSAVEFRTDEDFPEQPRNLQLVGRNRMIDMSWNAPLVRNGVINRYRVHVRSVGARYPIPSYCPLDPGVNETIELPGGNNQNSRTTDWNDDELYHTLKDLRAYTDYVIQIAAATKAGFGLFSEMVLVTTLPEEPESVLEFEEYNVSLPEVDKPYNSSVYITWKLPCHLNGRLRSFAGQFFGYRAGLEHTLDWSLPITDDTVEKFTFAEHRLEPEFRYNVSIIVFVEDVANSSVPEYLIFQSPAGIPEFKENVTWGSVDVMDAPNPTKTAKISLSEIIFESDVGSITYVALLLSERRCQQDPVPERNLSEGWPLVPSWIDVAEMSCIVQYQTTPKLWNPIGHRKRNGRNEEPILYVIGSDDCVGKQEYCNGPLKPGTEYALIVRIFTQSGYSDSAIQIFHTDSLIKLTLIITTIIGCLFVAFILGLLVLWRAQKLHAPAQTMVRSPNDEPSDIPLKSFSGIYDELVQSNKERINKEYQAINYFSEQLVNETVTFFVAKENERKNRYLGILPYDGNRVLLEVDDMIDDADEDVNDYINASFVDGYKYQREYIATQGPKKETSFDFWRMILQYEVESIVMLTQIVENEKIKCYQYFPRFNQQVSFRDIQVKCTQELNLTFYQKRLLMVTRGNLTKAVFHYHFLVWPDHGCPSSPTDLIKFIKIVRSERKNLALPVVVHCSAGVGRTGTFIALDVILQRIQQEKKINIYDIVKQLRRQRVKMVQTFEQYAFLYQSCLEYTTGSNRKKSKNSSDEILGMNSLNDRTTTGSGSGRRKPLVNIKFPKYVHSGISNVKSYTPDDIETF